MHRLLILVLLSLSAAAAIAQNDIVDYFLMLPDTAFRGGDIDHIAPDSFFSIERRRNLVDFYVHHDRDTMNDSLYSEYIQSVYYCTVEAIDPSHRYMTIKNIGSQYTPTELITYWREKSGTVLIGIGLTEGLEYGSNDNVQFYRYDGHAITNADSVIPKLPISAFISRKNLKKDKIPADTHVDVHFTLHTESKDIICFIDPDYDVTVLGQGPKQYYDPAFKHLKEEHLHTATLRLTDKGFRLVKK